jgi:ferredoxin
VLPVPAVWIPVVISQVIVIALWIFTSSQANGVPRKMGERVGARLRAQQATVNVDPGRCVRFGFCEHEAPQVFQLRSDGRLAYQPQVPADQIDAVIQAARVCPARAIMLTRTATTVVMSGQDSPPSEERAPATDSPREERTTAIPRVDRVREERPREEREEESPREKRPRSAPRADRPRTPAGVDGPRGVPRVDRPRAVPRTDERTTTSTRAALQEERGPRAVPREDRPRAVPREDRPRAVPRLDRIGGDEPRGPRAVPRDDGPRAVPSQRPTRLARRGGSRHGRED